MLYFAEPVFKLVELLTLFESDMTTLLRGEGVRGGLLGGVVSEEDSLGVFMQSVVLSLEDIGVVEIALDSEFVHVVIVEMVFRVDSTIDLADLGG